MAKEAWEERIFVGMNRRFGDYQGGIALRVLLIAISFVVVGGSIIWILQNFQRNQETNQRKALHISEYGLQRALEHLAENPSWSGGIPKTPSDGGWYEVEVKRDTVGNREELRIVSSGHSGSVVRRKTAVLSRTRGSPDSVWQHEYLE